MGDSVVKILQDQYGVAIRPGQKVSCPFCGHTTFGVKRDDTIGKCFHPDCGRFITAAHDPQKKNKTINDVIEDIYQDWHRKLLSLPLNRRNAHTYLVNERLIHPQVVSDSMLGSVPANYDLDAKFAHLLGEAVDAVKKGQSKRSKLDPKGWLVFLTETIGKLRTCIEGHEEWLCFFYTDNRHRIVSIRFREPYSKRIVYFKPFKKAGLFGHGLFAQDNATPLNTPLIITEGEFNQLQLQSICRRYGESVRRAGGYVYACAVGGVNNSDIDTIAELTRNPVVCFDNDQSGAGFMLVKELLNRMSVTAFTTPAPDSDLDEFLCGFGDDHTASWNAVKKLVSERITYSRPFDSVAAEIFLARQKQGKGDTRRDFEINSEVADIIRRDLDIRGQFYNDGRNGYFFFEAEKKMISISPEDATFTLSMSNFGINRAEHIFRYLHEHLCAHALKNGIRTEVHRLAYYDDKIHTVYLFNFGNQIYRITLDSIDLVDNGSDGVIFLYDPKAVPFVAELDKTDIGLNNQLFSKINFVDDVLSAEERRRLIEIWFLSIFFEQRMPTKPILALIGVKGSGKSFTIRIIGVIIFGEKFNVTPLTKDAGDFDTMVSNTVYAAFDNADTRCDWLADRLAIVATGGTIRKRELYTTNTLVEIPVKCFLAITSRTPQFRRDDIADRLLIMKVERFKTFMSEGTILRDITLKRNSLMGDVVGRIQNALQALQKYKDTDDSSAFRMADFADFALKIARHNRYEDEMRAIFAKLTKEQSAFTLEGNQIFDLLTEWTLSNFGREITSADLFHELSDLAAHKNVPFGYQTVRSFAQKMSNLRSNLLEFFQITERITGGRVKLYSFRLKTAHSPQTTGCPEPAVCSAAPASTGEAGPAEDATATDDDEDDDLDIAL